MNGSIASRSSGRPYSPPEAVGPSILWPENTMKSFRWARDIYAIGSNPEAAALAGLPVAVMSGGGWATEADARRMGLAVFLRKPVEAKELLGIFADHCGRTSN